MLIWVSGRARYYQYQDAEPSATVLVLVTLCAFGRDLPFP